MDADAIRHFLSALAEDYEKYERKEGEIDPGFFWYSVGGAMLEAIQPVEGEEPGEFEASKKHAAELLIAGVQRSFKELQ